MWEKNYFELVDNHQITTKQCDLIQFQCREVLDFYNIKEKVGQGAYGQVFKATSKDDQDQNLYALKKLIIAHEKQGFPQTSLREIKILQRLDHENILKIIEIATYTNMLKNKNRNNMKIDTYIIFDYMEHNFYFLIRKAQLNQGHIKCVMKQLLEGLNYLHGKNIIHRDLKTQNILVNKYGVLKIADFGLARYLEKLMHRPLTPIVVTLWYRSPEILLGDRNYDFKCDIWSAGIIMLEMLFGDCPFKGQNESSQLDAIFQKCGSPTEETWAGLKNLRNYKDLMEDQAFYECNLEESIKEQLSNLSLDNSTVDFIMSLLSLNPEFRFTAKQALDHKYFRDQPKIIPLSELSIIKEELHEILIKNNNIIEENKQIIQKSINIVQDTNLNFKRNFRQFEKNIQDSPELETLIRKR